jgi:hypothetical protein
LTRAALSAKNIRSWQRGASHLSTKRISFTSLDFADYDCKRSLLHEPGTSSETYFTHDRNQPLAADPWAAVNQKSEGGIQHRAEGTSIPQLAGLRKAAPSILPAPDSCT